MHGSMGFRLGFGLKNPYEMPLFGGWLTGGGRVMTEMCMGGPLAR